MRVCALHSANKCYQEALAYLIRDPVHLIRDGEIGVNLVVNIFAESNNGDTF